MDTQQKSGIPAKNGNKNKARPGFSLKVILSHKQRFSMLKAISPGSMSSRDLSELTGSKGGHHLCHLNVLTGAGLVPKNDSGKSYCITDQGYGAMDLKKIYSWGWKRRSNGP